MEPVGIFMGICIDLLEKKKTKTNYHAKIDIFLIDSKLKSDLLELFYLAFYIGRFYEI
jgi:hypothetical protein